MPGSEGLGGVVPAANAPSGPVAGVGVQPGTSSRVVATQVVIIGSGGELLVYSPTRALGNLIASIVGSNTGFDSVGNFFLSNITAYQDDGGTWLATQIFGGGIAFYTAPGPGSSYTQYAAIGGTTVGTLTLQAGGGSGAIAQFPPAVFGADGIAIVNALIAAGIFV
jgi:hypothetical protein